MWYYINMSYEGMVQGLNALSSSCKQRKRISLPNLFTNVDTLGADAFAMNSNTSQTDMQEKFVMNDFNKIVLWVV